MVEHVDITDPNLHEPKGASSASANTVYVADGAGSGTWQKVDESSLDYSAVLDAIQDDINDGDLELTGQYAVWCRFTDVSTADSILVPVLKDSVFKRATLVLGGAITSADSTVAFKNSAGSSMGTSVTIAQSGSAKGTTFSFTATSNNTITGPGYIEITTDGASSSVASLYMLLEFTSQFN